MATDARTIDYTRYCDYREMTETMQVLESEFPHLMKVESIGTSHQGRNLWLATITNKATGPDTEKPGYWIDGNIHAEEVVGTMVCLYTIERLVRDYGSDERITRLLDEQVFYILPRQNPDAAEICLTSPYPWCGNGRFMPEEIQTRGLRLQDLNGDGAVTMMRVPDPLGEWKVSSIDSRLMTQREPDEDDPNTQYYRLLPEGRLPGFDGGEIVIDPPRDGNLNRNYPANFLPEEFQYGAGRYPLSEPESRAVVEFIVDHPNIAGAEAYHTHGGVILRPFLNLPDSDFLGDDLAVYNAIGAMGTEETGYPVISVYEEFTTDKDQPRTGSFMEWAYEQLGIITFSTELWDVWRVAEIAEPDYFRFKSWGDEDKARLLAWVDEHNPSGYIDWQPFDHPELGPIEIGGWVSIWTFRNPPPALIEDECERNYRFTLRHAASAPRVGIALVEVDPLGADLYRIRAVIENRGYLPTNVSAQAIEKKIARPVLVTLDVGAAELVMGQQQQNLGHLAGRSERRSEWSPWGNIWGSPRRTAEWLVRAPWGTTVTITASSEKGGVAREYVTIEGGE